MTLLYWYMLPLAIVISTIATGIGIGGATFFAPLFILGFGMPPEVGIGTALIIEVFGFGSGLYAYARRRLIDYQLGTAMLVTTIPLALLGTWMAGVIEPNILKAILGVGLFAVAANFLRAPEQKTVDRMDAAIEQEYGGEKGETCLISSEGQEICYTVCNRTEGRLVAAVGALFKGMIATGLGEMDEHFFLERCQVPSVVSVATGVFVVLFTTLSASAGYLVRFALGGAQELAAVLSLVIFAIPGVILGGQVGPWIVAQFPQRALKRGLHILLLLVAALTLVEALL
jgi:uncharacterized membrane protein YfcA